VSRHRPEVERALAYIAGHLDEPMAVADIAREAHLSEFHLHRVFREAVGETIGRFVTRRRLETAALRLAYETDRTITDIALSSGYSSNSNFTKAFTAYFGVSPSRVREPASELPVAVGLLKARHGKGFHPADLYTLPPERPLDERREIAQAWNERVHFEEAPRRTFACLAGPGGYALGALMETWTELIDRGRQLGLIPGEEVDAWGVAHDSPDVTASERCRYDACIPCTPDAAITPPLARTEMPDGRYAVFRWKGAADALSEGYREVYSCWFPESAVAPADLESWDHYVTDWPENGQIELEMWFRVRPRQTP
jgi:AraC family transcriptional regulator